MRPLSSSVGDGADLGVSLVRSSNRLVLDYYERYAMNWIGPVVAVYVLACIVLTAAFIMWNFDEIRKGVLWSETRYGLFMAGVVFVMMTSPIWVPKIIIKCVQWFHQSVKEEMAKRES